MLVAENTVGLSWVPVRDFHLMVMSVLLYAVTRIPVSFGGRLGVGFMETGKFRILHWHLVAGPGDVHQVHSRG